MKTVRADGGPLIALSEKQTLAWQGIFGRSFARADTAHDSDYDMACYGSEQESKGPWSFALLQVGGSEAFLVSLPYETAIVASDEKHIRVAQVEFCDDDWGFERVNEDMFDKAAYDNEFLIKFDGSIYSLFDSAARLEDVGDDRLTFQLVKGVYRVEGGPYRPDENTSLILCRIEPVR